MFLLYFALMLFGIWFLANKKFGNNFVAWLKYPSLAFLLILAGVDIFFMYENQKLIETQQFGVNGISYSYFNNVTNSSVTTTMYSATSSDTGEIMAYHFTEYQAMKIITYVLPYLALLTMFGYLAQYFYMSYLKVKNG